MQNPRKKHKRFYNKLSSQKPAAQEVQEASNKLINESKLGEEETAQRLHQLN